MENCVVHSHIQIQDLVEERTRIPLRGALQSCLVDVLLVFLVTFAKTAKL